MRSIDKNGIDSYQVMDDMSPGHYFVGTNKIGLSLCFKNRCET